MFCGDGDTCTECITDVTLGRRHACYTRYDGTLWCAGLNREGQLGIPASEGPLATALQIHDETGDPITVVAASAGRAHSCAVLTDDRVMCWGRNTRGESGSGSVAATTPPSIVRKTDNTPLTGLVEVQAGDCFTCGRDAAGVVWCWGCNDAGELGRGTFTAPELAAPITSLGAVEDLSVGSYHTCVRLADRSVWCWGRNEDSELGVGGTAPRAVPSRVFENATSVSPGQFVTCATHVDTTVSCWGDSFHDRLGNGLDDSFNTATPTPVVTSRGGPPFTGAVDVTASSAICALRDDTSLWCWAKDLYGLTGTGGGASVPAPVQAENGDGFLVGVDRVEGHYAHGCAHLTSGRYVCWGRNAGGELLDGTTAHHGRPTQPQLTCP